MHSPTTRTRVSRIPDRGHYDAGGIHAILDAAYLCHIGFVIEEQPYVIPTLYGRDGDRVFFHGSAASRMLRHAATRVPVCMEVSLVDGIVLARSAFHHSMNYRSVVVLGQAKLVTEPDQKLRALEIISEHILPGRWADVRKPTVQELKATSVLTLGLHEASAKIRTGPPKDEPEDYDLPIWAGVLPISQIKGEAMPDPALRMDLAAPDYLRRD